MSHEQRYGLRIPLCPECGDKLARIQRTGGAKAAFEAMGAILCEACKKHVPGYQPGSTLTTKLVAVMGPAPEDVPTLERDERDLVAMQERYERIAALIRASEGPTRHSVANALVTIARRLEEAHTIIAALRAGGYPTPEKAFGSRKSKSKREPQQ